MWSGEGFSAVTVVTGRCSTWVSSLVRPPSWACRRAKSTGFDILTRIADCLGFEAALTLGVMTLVHFQYARKCCVAFWSPASSQRFQLWPIGYAPAYLRCCSVLYSDDLCQKCCSMLTCSAIDDSGTESGERRMGGQELHLMDEALFRVSKGEASACKDTIMPSPSVSRWH